MGSSAAGGLLKLLAAAKKPGSVAAISLAILAQGSDLAMPRLLAILCAASDKMLMALPDAVWLAPASTLKARLASPAVLSGIPIPLRSLLVRELGAAGQLPTHGLLELLSGRDLVLASAASDALGDLWSDAAVRELESVALSVGPSVLGLSTLTSAVYLGSRPALGLARSWLTQQASAQLLDLLAIAGDQDDLPIVSTLAAGESPLAAKAIETLGWLGSAKSIALLKDLVEQGEHADAATWSLHRIAGDVRALAAQTDDRRYLFGQPWTASAAAERLRSPLSSVWERGRTARELAIRTGVRGPIYHTQGPTEDQRRVAEEWYERLGTGRSHLPPGRWLRAGKPS
jgi:hypothetical protein